MLKIIIGLPILFIVICMAINFFQFMVEDLIFPKFIIKIGIICWVIFMIILVIFLAYVIGEVILGG